MAEHLQYPGLADYSYMVLWVILAIVSGVENSVISVQNGIEIPNLRANLDSIEHYRIQRSPDEEAFPFPSSESIEYNSQQEQDDLQLNNQNEDSEVTASEEVEKETDVLEEQTKSKQNLKQQKYTPSFFKNYNSNKVNSESRYLSSNESINEKQKSGMYNPQGYMLKQNSFNKKDTKLNSSSDYILRSNTSTPTIVNKIAKLDTEPRNSTNTMADGGRLNETHLMNDQPLDVASDLSNITELSDDSILDDLSQNITDLLSDTNNTTSADGRTMPASEGFDILVISGIILGTVVLLGLMAGGGFAVYRHRMWNKPQTLSDKCSNADSSGYIDDSTLRENSEEMYSLDNDSFLNSLEAMTIQNYWTDNVKHTKL